MWFICGAISSVGAFDRERRVTMGEGRGGRRLRLETYSCIRCVYGRYGVIILMKP